MTYFWLLIGRHWWSKFLNWLNRKEQRPMPAVFDLESVKVVLSYVKWEQDQWGDWIQSPALTWGLKRGDCEDFAALSMELLSRIGINAYLLSIVMSPMKYSHAVCVMPQDLSYDDSEGKEHYARTLYKYFSNSILVDQSFNSVEDIIKQVSGVHQVLYWSLEDSSGRTIKIQRGV
jgi:hypothetical protein